MIEIVTHAYSGPDVPVYHKLLAMQLNSILTYPPVRTKAKITVCYNEGDGATREVLDQALPYFRDSRRVSLWFAPLTKPELFRRACGRNKAALESTADVIWFTDCDHCFGYGALDAAHRRCFQSASTMVHPASVWINKTHDAGDALIENLPEWGDFQLPVNEFRPRRERNAWGGLQIVKGDWCRQHGYLDGDDRSRPAEGADHFLSCRGDMAFRRRCGGSKSVAIPSVFRIRHTRAGRDRGEKDHGEQTREK